MSTTIAFTASNISLGYGGLTSTHCLDALGYYAESPANISASDASDGTENVAVLFYTIGISSSDIPADATNIQVTAKVTGHRASSAAVTYFQFYNSNDGYFGDLVSLTTTADSMYTVNSQKTWTRSELLGTWYFVFQMDTNGGLINGLTIWVTYDTNPTPPPEPPSSDYVSDVLGTYSLISGTFYSENSANYFSSLSGNDHTEIVTTGNFYSSGSGVQVVFQYAFDYIWGSLFYLNAMNGGIKITGVECLVNGHAESTSSSQEYMCVQLKVGNTAISEQINFKDVGTSNEIITLTATTIPTLSQFQDLVLECTLGYYGGAINGATVRVYYTLPTFIPVKVDGEWSLGRPQVKVNGNWEDVTAVYVKVDGSWQPPPPEPTPTPTPDPTPTTSSFRIIATDNSGTGKYGTAFTQLAQCDWIFTEGDTFGDYTTYGEESTQDESIAAGKAFRFTDTYEGNSTTYTCWLTQDSSDILLTIMLGNGSQDWEYENIYLGSTAIQTTDTIQSNAIVLSSETVNCNPIVSGYYSGTISGAFDFSYSTITVIFDGVSYVCQKTADDEYGAPYDGSSFDWTDYPFQIWPAQGSSNINLSTETSGNHTIAIIANQYYTATFT